MKLVDRFSMIVFSIIVFILSGFTILVSTNIIDVDIFNSMFDLLSENIVLTVCVCILLCLWSVSNIFFRNGSKNENANGVLLENANGSLLITRESISNLVESVLKKNDEIKEASVKIEFDADRDVIINIVAIIKDNAIIKETSSKLQENIKLAIKRATDLEVSNVNIKIKNVEQEKKVTPQ